MSCYDIWINSSDVIVLIMLRPFPHEGDVQRTVLGFLYKYRDTFTTKQIVRHIDESHGSTFQALSTLYERRYVLRGRYGRHRTWSINPDAPEEEVRRFIGLPRKTMPRREEPEFRPTYVMVKEVGYPIIKTSLNIVLPMVAPQVYVAYKLAESIFTYWDVISSCYSSYKTQGIPGVAKTLGKSAVSYAAGGSIDYVANSETNIIWNGIKDKIPTSQQSQVKSVMQTTLEEFDEKEIDYVESYLSKN